MISEKIDLNLKDFKKGLKAFLLNSAFVGVAQWLANQWLELGYIRTNYYYYYQLSYAFGKTCK